MLATCIQLTSVLRIYYECFYVHAFYLTWLYTLVLNPYSHPGTLKQNRYAFSILFQQYSTHLLLGRRKHLKPGGHDTSRAFFTSEKRRIF